MNALQIGEYDKVRYQALKTGLRRKGVTILTPTIGNLDVKGWLKYVRDHKIDFAFTGTMRPANMIQRLAVEEYKIPFLVTDCGFFKRSQSAKDKEGYNQLGWNKLCWTPEKEVPSDRWDFLKLTIKPKVEKSDKPVLILGQVPDDGQHNMSETELANWLLAKCIHWVNMGFDIKLRPHPKAIRARLPSGFGEIVHPAQPLLEIVQNYSKIITYNSTGGLEALINGVTVDCHPSAHYGQFVNLDNPEAFQKYCHKLAYSQWTCDELESGMALDFMFSNFPR